MSRRSRDRWSTALAAGLTLLRDPKRVDQVLVLADIVNVGAYRRIHEAMAGTSSGQRVLAMGVVWTKHTVDYDSLRVLPEGTLGREYVRFLDANALDIESLAARPQIRDAKAAMVARRMRQTHDIWHVLTGYEPDVRGELLLQAFTYAQAKTPSALLITLFGVLRWMLFYRGLVLDIVRAYRRGRHASLLAAIRWEEEWSTPVTKLRKELRITEARG